MDESGDPLHVRWDRYLGHNIACLAVDGNGEIIDFDFNHNDFFGSLAAIPIKASLIGLPYFDELITAYAEFRRDILAAKDRNDKTRAFFVPPDGRPADFAPSITSFLCTDAAYSVFSRGGDELENVRLDYPREKYPNKPDSWENQKCLDEAKHFYQYADVEGFRGSPHKL